MMATPPLWTVTVPQCQGMALLWTAMAPLPMRHLFHHTRLLCPLMAPPPMAPRYLSVFVGDSSSAEAPPVTRRMETKAVTAELGTMLLSLVMAPPASREHSTLEEAEDMEEVTEVIKARKQSS